MTLPEAKQSARRRRGNGEGAIGKTADGRWCARVSLGYVNGKRARKAVYGITRAEVAKKLASLLKAKADNAPMPNDSRRVKHLLDEWLAKIADDLRPKTVRCYRQQVTKHIKPALGEVVVTKLTALDVDAFLTAKEGEGLKPRHRQLLRATLRAAWRYAMKHQYASQDVVRFSTAPSVQRATRPAFPLEDAQKLLQLSQAHRLGAIVTLGLALGARQGELLGLRWSNVDLEAGVLHIDAQLQELKANEANQHATHVIDAFYLQAPKSTTSRRSITLPDMCIKALKTHRAAQAAEQLKAGSKWNDLGFVFTTARGKPVSAANARRFFNKLVDDAGLPKRRFHDMRHATATLLLAQGVPPRVVQSVLGHSDIRMTIEIYNDVHAEQKQAAATAMDALLG